MRETNLASANLSNVIFLNADLQDTILTMRLFKELISQAETAGGLLGAASFLTLAGCEGLAIAKLSPGVLQDYLAEAFVYAHDKSTPESEYVREFVSGVVSHIKASARFLMKPIAHRMISSKRSLPSACDVARCAAASGAGVETVGRLYFAMGLHYSDETLEA